MQTRSIFLATSCAALMALTGCAGTSNQQLGTGAGAVLGGVAGNAIFGGTAGAVGGAAVGALVGNEVGKTSDTRNYDTRNRAYANRNDGRRYSTGLPEREDSNGRRY